MNKTYTKTRGIYTTFYLDPRQCRQSFMSIATGFRCEETLILLASCNLRLLVCVYIEDGYICAQHSKRNYARCHAVIGRFTDRFTLSECVCASVLYSKKY